MTLSVNLIGAGRVGQTLLRLFTSSPGVNIRNVASSRIETAERAVAAVGQGEARALGAMSPADLWFLTVPDTQLAPAAEALAASGAPPAIAVHCSGYCTAAEMAPLGAKGWSLASAHPMQSFVDPAVSAARFPGTYVGLEGDPNALAAVGPLFESLGARTFRIASDAKPLYHAAAVVTNNFTTVLQAIALETWDAAGVPAEVARDLNETLLRSTLENLARLGPAQALTGPAARGDRAVVEAETRDMTAWHPEAGRLYDLMSVLAARLKATGTTRP